MEQRCCDEGRFVGRPCSGGLDLSSVSDLTSWVLAFPCLEDPAAVDVLHRSFVPEAQLEARRNPKRGSQYRAWADGGWLLVTPGDAVDYAFIKARVLADAARFQLRSVGLDRLWQGQGLMNDLVNEGVNCQPFGQGFLSMGPAVANFERRLLARQIHHGADPVLRWAVSNAVVRRDPAGLQKLDKERSADKIDPLVALVMALSQFERDSQAPAESAWDGSFTFISYDR
jgi:phage terminase large subunit-like protein